VAAEDSPLTGYLVAEVVNAQPPQVRKVLLCTFVLDHVSADAAVELAADERAAAIVMAVARANAFIEPAGSGWYRYHTLFAEVLRLKLRCEYPDRMTRRTAVVGGQGAKNDRPSVRVVRDDDPASIRTPSGGMRREERPWCLTLS